MKQIKNHLREPGSAITHFIGMILAIIASVPLLYRANQSHSNTMVVSLAIFIFSMILLYAASTTYHSLDLSPRINKVLKKTDHMMIFILIAGSYTPLCMITLHGRIGTSLCILVWSLALIGIFIKGFWIYCPKWFSSVIYIAMGWVCVFALKPIIAALSPVGFNWLLTGGILYTIGGVLYSLKLPVFEKLPKNFGSHEIFHIFVMAGSICHFIVMYCYVAA